MPLKAERNNFKAGKVIILLIIRKQKSEKCVEKAKARLTAS